MAVEDAVAATEETLKNAAALAEYERVREGTEPITLEQVETQLRMLVDRLMSEAGIYAPTIAAWALKQSEGRMDEAASLMRAELHALPRRYASEILDTAHIFVERRISSSFREIPGGQVLGATRDYTQRLLEESLANETAASAAAEKLRLEEELEGEELLGDPRAFSRVTSLLKTDGLMVAPEAAEDRRPRQPHCEPIQFPHHRSEALAALARGETGMIMALGYASQRGFGGGHGTIGELRVGRIRVRVVDGRGRARIIGQIRVTECEMVGRFAQRQAGALPSYSVGYGLCFGQNETKAICMGKLESSVREPRDDIPASSPEYVLSHIDGCMATGAVKALAMPHESGQTAEKALRIARLAAFRAGEGEIPQKIS